MEESASDQSDNESDDVNDVTVEVSDSDDGESGELEGVNHAKGDLGEREISHADKPEQR